MVRRRKRKVRRRPKILKEKTPKVTVRRGQGTTERPLAIIQPPNWTTLPLEIAKYVKEDKIEEYERIKQIYLVPLNQMWRPGVFKWAKMRIRYWLNPRFRNRSRSYGLFLDWLGAVYLKGLVHGIIKQANWLQLRKLSERYEKYKEEKGLDPRVLIASAFYINSLRKRSYGHNLIIEAKPEKHPNCELTYPQLAQILEFGTKRMVKIPHWVRTRNHIESFITPLLRYYFVTDDINILPNLNDFGWLE